MRQGWAVVLATLVSAPASAEWRAIETRHFTVYSEDTPANAERFVETLESYDKLMRMATGTPDEKAVKVRIYQVEGLDDVEQALGVTNTGIAGFYDNNSIGPFAVTPRKTTGTGRYFTPELVLHHEYAHHFMLQYFPAIYPGWYVEGFAELIGSSKMLDDGRIGYGMPALHRGNEIVAYWVPLQDLLTKDKNVDLDTYGQGWAVTHFLTFNKERSKQFRAYLTALQKGASKADAAKAFGDLNELNQEARRYVGSGSFPYKAVKAEISRPVIESVRPMSPGEVESIRAAISYRDDDLRAFRKPTDRDHELKLREANLKRIQEVVQRHPADPVPLYIESEIEQSMGHSAEAEAAINRLLALQPSNARAMARKSILLAQRAKGAEGDQKRALVNEARAIAQRSNHLDPADPVPLLAYFQSFHQVGERPPSVAIDGLRQAASTLPGNSDIRMLLVNQLVDDRHYAEAIGWLMPLANSSHKSPLRDAARERLAEIQALMKATPKSDG